MRLRYPNQVPAFGVVCVARLFFVMPGAWTAALTEAVAAPTTLVGALYRAVAVAAAAASALTTSTPGISIDYAIPASTLLSFVGARAIALDAAADAPSRNDGLDDDEEDDDGPPPSALARRGDAAFLALTFFYVFLAQPLGVVDVSGVSPFSGIRAHGGSNHLFMPTALLQRWKADEEGGDWGGGVVRVTSSTSTFLNDLSRGGAERACWEPRRRRDPVAAVAPRPGRHGGAATRARAGTPASARRSCRRGRSSCSSAAATWPSNTTRPRA